MFKENKTLSIAMILMALLTLPACTTVARLDNFLGETFFSDQASTTGPTLLDRIRADNNASSTRGITLNPNDLTSGQKDKIEAWLTEQGLNRYGDKDGTYYTGGTPLFDEATGQAIERFQYILSNHKDLVELLKAGN